MTNIISGSDYLTVNLFLIKVWRVKDILAKKSRDENDYLKAMVVKMNIKLENIPNS